MYLFWKYLHIVGGFGFVASHGATAAVSLRLRKEREPERIRALLELSRSTRSWMYVSLLVLLAGGIANGFLLHAWGRGWIWAAVILLALMIAAAFPLAVPYYKSVRLAVEAPEPDQEALAALLVSQRPIAIAVVETAGILVILWLMIYKPF